MESSRYHTKQVELPFNQESEKILSKMLTYEGQSVSQSCPTLCKTVDCDPPGPSVHGILQARILEIQGIFLTQGSNPGLLNCRQILYRLSSKDSWEELWEMNKERRDKLKEHCSCGDKDPELWKKQWEWKVGGEVFERNIVEVALISPGYQP